MTTSNLIYLPRRFTIIECERRITKATRAAGVESQKGGHPIVIVQRNPKSVTVNWECEAVVGGVWELGEVTESDMKDIDALLSWVRLDDAHWSRGHGCLRGLDPGGAEMLLALLARVRVHYPDRWQSEAA